ncbi:MmgE/PrpD family protein [Sphingobium lactosutens]|uniref:MmgE/PrpD family protein n=1 Tax=Sphingobium lactosutens TaxID=522773 RepID=UPI0015BE30E1|nr:MmgE/PrpD family protein [Sphingobium lactosutens]
MTVETGLTDRQPLTAMLAQSIVTAGDRQPTEAHHAAVRRILIDWLGVAVAGSAEPVAKLMRAEFGPDAGAISLIGARTRASVANAALINGTAGHALDYDDIQPFVGHPGAVVVPAALAVGEALGADGELFVRAIIAGYDAAHFVGSLVMPAHYDHGFHSTATVGTFGAVAASAVLMRLDQGAVQHAIGLAATQAAGLKCMFGTMAKPYHAGRACSAGVTAASLAARGMTASADSLEADRGFLSTQAHQPIPPGWRAPEFGDSLASVQFKHHASCFLTHSSIEAVRSIVLEHGISPHDVADLTLRVPSEHLKTCNIAEPETGFESKFSLRHVAALVLGGHDTADIDVFSDHIAQEPGLRELRQKVLIRGDLDSRFEARATLRDVDGSIFNAAYDTSLGRSGRSDDLDASLDRKFSALAAPFVGEQAMKEILQKCQSIPDLDLAHLLEMLKAV